MKDPETYEVLIVKYGTRPAMRSDVFLNYQIYGEPDAPIGMDYFIWIARNADRTVVIDTGFSRAGGARRSRTMLVDPLEALDALGVRPEDGPLVVVTHAHYDHIGNLARFAQSPVIIAQREMEFWAGPYSQRAQFHHSVEDDELDALRDATTEGRVRIFDDRMSIGTGIEIMRVGGHTPGQSIVTVRTTDGIVLLASDAVHYYEEYERDLPFVSATNLVEMYAGFDTVRELLKNGHADHLVSGHDPGTLARFTPLRWPLAGAVASIGGTD